MYEFLIDDLFVTPEEFFAKIGESELVSATIAALQLTDLSKGIIMTTRRGKVHTLKCRPAVPACLCNQGVRA